MLERYPSYFYEFDYGSIIIPVKLASDKAGYAIKPFSTEVWILVFVALAYFTWTLSLLDFIINRNLRILYRLQQCLAHCLSIPLSPRSIKDFKVIHSFILIFSVIMCSYYDGRFGSVFIIGNEVSEFQIICDQQSIDMMINTPHLKFLKIPTDEHIDRLYKANASFGYCTYKSVWNNQHFVIRKLKLFRLLDEYQSNSVPYAVTFHRNYSFLWPLFKSYYLNMYSYGIMNKWQRESSLRSFEKVVDNWRERMVIRATDLVAVSTCTLLGFGLAGVCFLFEVFIKLFSKNN